MEIRDLATHPQRFITVAELAAYWGVSRQQIYKRIEAGQIGTIRFGARCYRILTQSALAYEQDARVTRGDSHSMLPPIGQEQHSNLDENQMPKKIGLQRLRRMASRG